MADRREQRHKLAVPADPECSPCAKDCPACAESSPAAPGPAPQEPLQHSMNCGATSFDGYDAGQCTCGLDWRIKLRTEQEMHAAWRKRAEEAEEELTKLRAGVAATVETPPADKCSECGVRRDNHRYHRFRENGYAKCGECGTSWNASIEICPKCSAEPKFPEVNPDKAWRAGETPQPASTEEEEDTEVLLDAADYLHELGGGPMEDRLRLLYQNIVLARSRRKREAGQ